MSADQTMRREGPSEATGVVLSLGGGGARAFAHVGVLKALEEIGVPVVAVAGTSMGALIGGLYAAGVPLADLEAQVLRVSRPIELLKLADVGLSLALRGDRILALMTEMLGGDRTIEELPRPFAAVATDLESGRPVTLRRGSLVGAIRASISIPGVFEAVGSEDGRMRLVDGGILDNVPGAVAAALDRRPVVAVDVLPRFADNQPGEPPRESPLRSPTVPAFLEDLVASLEIMLAEITELRRAAAPPALTLRPRIDPEVTILAGFDRGAETIEAGRRATLAARAALLDLSHGGTPS